MARVVVSKKTSCCEKCEKDVCDINDDGVETVALNAAGARIGQRVKVVMQTYTYYKGALLVYIFPVIALIGGAILGKIYLPLYITVSDSDLLAALGGFVTFLVSLIFVKLITGSMEKKTENKPVIESIVED